MQHSSLLTYARAKRMRREPTEAERRLWGALRGRRLGGLKFYRQVPVGPYIVDFINQEVGVVIEVDGVTHGDAHEVEHDKRRTAFLEAKGLLVHRVDNHQVYCHLTDVLDGIYAVVMERAAKGPHPSRALRDPPSPEGKGQV
jgi:very-short-patch-repair endonuclease